MTGRAFEAAVAAGMANGIVEDPMITAAAFVARLITLSETVIAEPGTSVCDPRT